MSPLQSLRSGLLLVLCPFTVPAAHAAAVAWTQVTSPHFTVLTDAGEKEGRHIAAQLEEMRAVEAVVSPGGVRSQSITILALHDRKDFRAIEPPAYLAPGALDLAGYFMQNVDGYHIILRLDADGEHPFETVYHEYTHFSLSPDSVWLPIWLNEGFAEFFQNTTFYGKSALLGQPSVDDILYLRQQRLMPIRTLLTVDAASPYYHEEQKGSVFYAQSWALTHMLLVEDRMQHTQKMQNYANALQNHEDSLTAAQQAFGDLGKLQQQLETYIHSADYKAFELKIVLKEDESAYAAQPVSTAHADAIRAEILADNDRLPEARALAAQSLAAAPGDPVTHEAVGFLALHDGDKAAALQAFRAAVQDSSTDASANYYFAETSLELADFSNSAAIEASLKQVIAANPSDGNAYDALARLYISLPDRHAEAHMMNVDAIASDPGNVSFRLNAASVLQSQGMDAGAIQVLQAAEHITRNSGDVLVIEARIAQLEDRQKALAREQAMAAQEQADALAQPEATPETAMPAQAAQHAALPEAAGAQAPGTRTMLINGQKVVVHIPASEVTYPAEQLTGATHSVNGSVASVSCTYPKVMTLKLHAADGRTLTFYRNDFFTIDYTQRTTQKGDFKPCEELTDAHVRLSYAGSKAPGIDGQIVSIYLER